jgi:hypothetical protein
MTLSSALLRAARCGYLLKNTQITRALAMEKHGGHEDLRGLAHQSIIPYIHGRVCCTVVCACAVQAVS